MAILSESDGDDSVIIYLADTKQMKKLGRNMNVSADDELMSKLKAHCGEKNIAKR